MTLVRVGSTPINKAEWVPLQIKGDVTRITPLLRLRRFRQSPLYSSNRLVSQSATLQERSAQCCKRAKHKNYTGQQKKGYKVICLLFCKTEWHILFAYCKHNVCCFRVDLPNLNQVQWSETSARLSLNGFAWLARYLSFWVLWKPNSRCGREIMFFTSGKSTNFNN